MFKKLGYRVLVYTLLILMTGGTIMLLVSVYAVKKISAFSRDVMEAQLWDDYDELIKSEVESMVTLIEPINKRIKEGSLSEKEGKKLAADIIREVRYGKEGYFWVDTLEGVNVVLLGKEDVEGTDRTGLTDVNGFKIVEDFVRIGNSAEGCGYSDYWFPKAGETEPSQKRAYIQTYAPFGWMIGTGNYVDNIDEMLAENRKRSDEQLHQMIFTLLAIIAAFVVLCIVIMLIFAKRLSKDIANVNYSLSELSKYNLNYKDKKDYSKRKDEIGDIFRATALLKEELIEVVKNIFEYAQNTAATAEELTATSQTAANFAGQVSSAVSNIADGATSQAHDTQEAAGKIDGSNKLLNDMFEVLNGLLQSTDIYHHAK